MEPLISTSSKLRAGYRMIKTFFGYTECRDPKTMHVELEDIRLVNFGSSLEFTLRICNTGITDLKVDSIYIKPEIARCGLEATPLAISQVIKSETLDGDYIKVLLPTPYLMNPELIKQINDEHNINLYEKDDPFVVGIEQLKISFRRNLSSGELDLQLNNHLKWTRKVQGLNYYIKAQKVA
ncbi:hypothetical protein ACPV5J_19070 [Vibrio rotiferianus]|uniref:hypothetical protein n=1 Tax=Vibrio rotiferianus TaxID=190895 RepID=UPI00406A6BAC